MQAVMQDEDELLQRIYVFPDSAIRQNGKKISYYELLSSDAFPLCTAALRTVLPRINLKEIGEMIDEIPS